MAATFGQFPANFRFSGALVKTEHKVTDSSWWINIVLGNLGGPCWSVLSFIVFFG